MLLHRRGEIKTIVRRSDYHFSFFRAVWLRSLRRRKRSDFPCAFASCNTAIMIVQQLNRRSIAQCTYLPTYLPAETEPSARLMFTRRAYLKLIVLLYTLFQVRCRTRVCAPAAAVGRVFLDALIGAYIIIMLPVNRHQSPITEDH